MSEQKSQKQGKRSDAQKIDSSRHGFDPIPATSPVGGASGTRESGKQSDEEASFAHHQRERSVAEEESS
jgi:hypothetical protein